MHTPSLAGYVRLLDSGDWAGVGELMLASAQKLAGAGADFLICPDNTPHQALPHVLPRSPLPWLHIAEEVAAEAAARGLECVRPAARERDEASRIIMDELVCGVFKPASTAALVATIEGFRAQGCDAVILGCTELPLVLGDANSPLPTLDSTRLLARAALRRAVQGR
jgi:aspartate racemase